MYGQITLVPLFQIIILFAWERLLVLLVIPIKKGFFMCTWVLPAMKGDAATTGLWNVTDLML